MPKANINGLDIQYDLIGDAGATPFLLIAGLGLQLTRYTERFCGMLADHGFRVIRMDNRDVGLSGGFDSDGIPDFRMISADRKAGLQPQVPYGLEDMADDCAGLLSHLEMGPAHVAGMSMGGMITQLMAIRHPEQVTTITSVMSTTGHPELPRATPEAQAVLVQRRSDPETQRDAFLDEAVETARVIGSPAYPEDPADIRERAAADLDRAFRPTGFARQYGAILAAPQRREALERLSLPALVIHGTDDPLIPVEHGRDTAKHIPGCDLLEIEGMGHDLPAALDKTITDALAGVAARG